jgi:hypothetical protein
LSPPKGYRTPRQPSLSPSRNLVQLNLMGMEVSMCQLPPHCEQNERAVATPLRRHLSGHARLGEDTDLIEHATDIRLRGDQGRRGRCAPDTRRDRRPRSGPRGLFQHHRPRAEVATLVRSPRRHGQAAYNQPSLIVAAQLCTPRSRGHRSSPLFPKSQHLRS